MHTIAPATVLRPPQLLREIAAGVHEVCVGRVAAAAGALKVVVAQYGGDLEAHLRHEEDHLQGMPRKCGRSSLPNNMFLSECPVSCVAWLLGLPMMGVWWVWWTVVLDCGTGAGVQVLVRPSS